MDAYPFVRLHQPAAWYGVNSKPLGSGGADLSSKAQILAYYELVMEDLVTTGRLTYLPQCEPQGKGQVKSLLDEDIEYQVNLEESTLKRILKNLIHHESKILLVIFIFKGKGFAKDS